MTPKATRVLIGVALVATVAAAWFAPQTGEQGVALTDRTRTVAKSANNSAGDASRKEAAAISSARGVGKPQLEVLSIRPREALAQDDEDSQLFASTQWRTSVAAPVVIAPVEAAPAPPQAPPLPFRLLGRYEQDGQSTLFLQYNDQNLVVRVGDTIAEQYKVEALSATTLSLLYLPLNQRQTLEVGSAQ